MGAVFKGYGELYSPFSGEGVKTCSKRILTGCLPARYRMAIGKGLHTFHGSRCKTLHSRGQIAACCSLLHFAHYSRATWGQPPSAPAERRSAPLFVASKSLSSIARPGQPRAAVPTWPGMVRGMRPCRRLARTQGCLQGGSLVACVRELAGRPPLGNALSLKSDGVER